MEMHCDKYKNSRFVKTKKDAMCPGNQLHNPAHVQCVLIAVWTQASSGGGGSGLQSVIKRRSPGTWLSGGTQTLQALMEPDDHISQRGTVQPGERSRWPQKEKINKKNPKPNQTEHAG